MPLGFPHRAGRAVRRAAAFPPVRLLQSRPGPALFAVCAALLELRVLVPTPVGLADNTDEARILCRLRLQPVAIPGQHYSIFFYLNLHYRVNHSIRCTDRYRTTEYPFVWLASKISLTLVPGRGLDARILGAVHITLVAACIALITTAARTAAARLVTVLGLLVLAADPLVADYFQAAYSENAEFIGVLAACGGFLWWRRGGRAVLPGIAVFAAGSIIALGAKTQMLPSLPLFALLALAAGRAAWPARRSDRRPDRAAAAALLAAVLVFLAVLPPSADGHLKFANKMNLVFVSLLPAGHAPRADLRELGLPAHLATLENLNYWCMDLPNTYSRELSKRLSFPEVGLFLAQHPVVAARMARSAAVQELAARPTYSVCPGQRTLGTHTVASGAKPDRVDTRLELITDLARHARPLAPLALLLGWVLPVAAVLEARRRGRGRDPFAGLAVFASGLALVQFATAAFGDGIDTTKHSVLSLFAMVLGLLFALVSWCNGPSEGSDRGFFALPGQRRWLQPLLRRGGAGNPAAAPQQAYDDEREQEQVH